MSEQAKSCMTEQVMTMRDVLIRTAVDLSERRAVLANLTTTQKTLFQTRTAARKCGGHEHIVPQKYEDGVRIVEVNFQPDPAPTAVQVLG